MKWQGHTTDQLEQVLAAVDERIAQARGIEIEILEELDRRQTWWSDGSQSMIEWTAARLDCGRDTAKKLVTAMRRTADRPHLREALADGRSFDRIEAVARLKDEDSTLDHLDIAAVRRTVAKRRDIYERDETRTTDDRYLVMQPSLDKSWWKLTGGLDGVAGSVVDNALTELADRLPDLPDGTRPGAGWRRATALYELVSGGASPEARVTVFVDAVDAVASNGRRSMHLEAGPRIGVKALSAIVCNSVSEVTVNAEDGIPMRYGRLTRTIPPTLRRAILATTDGHCAIDGCDSTYRVEIHHRLPWSHGGMTDPENLVPLCWFHHHIAVHERGFEVFNDLTNGGRLRLRRSTRELGHGLSCRFTDAETPPEGTSVGVGTQP